LNIEIRDERFLDIVPRDFALQTLADGLGFTEGPIWHPREKRLWDAQVNRARVCQGVDIHRRNVRTTWIA